MFPCVTSEKVFKELRPEKKKKKKKINTMTCMNFYVEIRDIAFLVLSQRVIAVQS